MLRVVRDRERDVYDDRRGHRENYGERGEYYDSRGYRRRSVGARVGFTLLIALVLAAGGAGAWLWADPAAFEALRARLIPPAPAAPTRPVTAGQTAAPAPAPPAAELPPVPDVYSLVMLIRNAILGLAAANASGNYAILRELAAPGFQQATTPASLAANFASLRSEAIDLSEVAVANPRLVATPAVDARGMMRLVGYFPVADRQVNFDLVFQVVDRRWRLFGIGVAPARPADGATPARDAKPAAKPVAGKVPDDPSLIRLIRTTIIALNQANLTGDYSVLRENAAQGFQEANSAAKLADLFAPFRTRGLDLSPVSVIDPRLFKPAYVDDKGYLRMGGFFPSRPEQVNFDLAYELVDGAWRLFGIGLNTTAVPDTAAPAADTAAPPARDKASDAAKAAPAVPKLSPPKP